MPSRKRGSHSVAAGFHLDSDFDLCRRGKRRRRDNFSPVAPEKCPALSTYETRLQTNHEPTFATTSAQFNLFSRPPNPGGKGRRNPISEPKVQHERQHGYLTDLVRLRSSAFWELRQSISENGEGLVRRMRDYEKSRSRHQIHHKAKEAEKKERKKLRFRKKKVFVDTSDSSDDDVLISSGESANHILRGTFLRKMKDPNDVMDVDSDWPSVHPTRNRSSSSAHDTQYTTSSPVTDDESSVPAMGTESVKFLARSPAGSLHSSVPSLSYSADESPCLSLASLPIPSSIPSKDLFDSPSPSSSSLASEKIIAALNLALANGAGSITDYSPVNYYEEIFSVENYDHGDLWN